MRRITFLFTLLALAAGLTACGDDDSGAAVSGDAAPSAETSAETEETTEEAGGPITITDGTGTEVTLDEPATTVVALEWALAESVVLLDAELAGAADAAGYGEWVAEPALPEGVEDVGTRQEASIERIQALQPDLILGVDFRHAAVRDQLEAIAPTYLASPYAADAGSQYEDMRQTFEDIGALTGTEDRAAEVLDDLDAHLADAGAELEEAGLAGQEIAIAQGFTTDGTPTVRMFSPNALVIELLAEIGLPNGWPGGDTEYGFDTVDVEGLTQLGDVELFTIAQEDDDMFTTAFAGNPIWEGLPTVQRGAVHPLGGTTWTFGGPASAEIFVDRVVDALVP